MSILSTSSKYIFTFLLLFSFLSFSEKPAYLIFNKKGTELTYKKMTDALEDADVVLFGELHNNPISHWLEFSILKDLHQQKKNDLMVGAEMFEADDQLKVDEYIEGKITESNFSKEAKVWDNYKTDYFPLIQFAAFQKLKFVATNIPRRYASLVARQGLPALDSLSEAAKKFIAPLPITVDLSLPGYKMLEMPQSPHAKSPGMAFLPQAQAVKDATMAYFILKNLKKGKLFLHFNGSYHSQNYEGIYWYLKKQNPDLKILTIASVEQEYINVLEESSKNTADFIICIPSDMAKTY